MSEPLPVAELSHSTPMKCACGWRGELKEVLKVSLTFLRCPECKGTDLKHLQGVQSIGGNFGMDSEPSWEAAVAEDDRDPFSVPREVVKERANAMVVRACTAGRLGHYGVQREDYEAAAEFFREVWGANCVLFALLEDAFHLPDAAGKAAVAKMGKGKVDFLSRFGVDPRDPAGIAAWYDWAKARHRERFSKPKP